MSAFVTNPGRCYRMALSLALWLVLVAAWPSFGHDSSRRPNVPLCGVFTLLRFYRGLEAPDPWVFVGVSDPIFWCYTVLHRCYIARYKSKL